MLTKKCEYPVNIYFSRKSHNLLSMLRTELSKKCELDDIVYVRKEAVKKLVDAAYRRGYNDNTPRGEV